MALVGITGVMNSTPTKALETLLSISPIDLYIEQEATITAIRLRNVQCWYDSAYGHAAILTQKSDDIPELLMHTDKSIPMYYFEKNFNVLIPQRTEWENGEVLDPSEMSMFTDGSKIESGTGSGIYSSDLSLKVSTSLGQYATISQAEIYAIIEICDEISKRKLQDREINNFTDSQASIKALQSHCFTSKTTMECHERLIEISAANKVNLVWVPGHQNIEGNEEADDAARTGSINPFYGPEPALGLTYATQRKIIRDYFKNKHRILWQGLQNCKHSRELINGPNSNITRYLLNKPRNDLRKLIGILTGHCNLNKHMFRMGLVQEELCVRCNEEAETPLHLLSVCPAIADARRSMMENPFPNAQQLRNMKISKLHRFARKYIYRNEVHT